MLNLRGVSVRYGHNIAVSGVDLSVERGEFVAVVGANGAGKTSLLRAISGVRSYDGSITLEDMEIRGRPVEDIIRKGLSHVPQGRLLFPRMSARDNLLVGAHAIDTADAYRRLAALESEIDVLSQRANQATRTMSGGEQQLVAVARGLMSGPRLLLLDEPSLGLAPVMIRKVMDIVQKEHQGGLTVVLAEQNVVMAQRYASRMIVMRQGRIVMDRPAADLTTEDIVGAYLGDHGGTE